MGPSAPWTSTVLMLCVALATTRGERTHDARPRAESAPALPKPTAVYAAPPTSGPLAPTTRVLPPRPESSGLGLFLAGAGLFTLAAAQQFLAVNVARGYRRCLAATQDGTDAGGDTLADERSLICSFGPQIAAGLRTSAAVEAVAAVGFVAWGASARARLDAYDDVMALRGPRRTRPLLIAGGSLTALAVTGWITARAVIITSDRCTSLVCQTGADAIATDVAAVLGGAGLGMLAYGLRYRAAAREGIELRFQAGVPGAHGLALAGRF